MSMYMNRTTSYFATLVFEVTRTHALLFTIFTCHDYL